MAVILTRRGRRHQPQSEVVGIDWANPLTRGLVFAVPYAGAPDAVSNTVPALRSGFVKTTGSKGVVQENVDSTAWGATYPHPPLLPLSLPQLSLFLYVENIASWASYGNLFATAYSSSGHGVSPFDMFALQRDGANNAVRVFGPRNTTPQFIVFASTQTVTTGNRYSIGFARAGGANAIFNINGTRESVSDANGWSDPLIGSTPQTLDVNNITGKCGTAAVWTRNLSADELDSIRLNPWQLFAPVRRRIFFDAGAAAAITGTLTGTLDAATSAATGTVLISGTAAPTFDAATLAATGALAISGTLTGTLDAATVNATSALAIAGAATQTLSDATAASTGALAIAGTLTGTLADASLAATGVIGTITTGALDATLEAATVAATGALAIAGTAAPTLADATAAATGTVALAGAATVTLDAATVVAAGNITISGALAQTLADAALAATGAAGAVRTGVLAVTLANATMAARMYPSSAGPIGSSGPLHRPTEARRAKQAAERRPPNRR